MSAREVIENCRTLACFTDEPGYTTRTFLSPQMRPVHAHLRSWMERIGMSVDIDAAGNLRGTYCPDAPNPALWIGSHLDTVPRAGAFDGILGVVLAIALVEALQGRPTPFPIEVVGFSEEEGVRFGVPFVGSRALIGDAGSDFLSKRDPNGISIAEAIRHFGLNPDEVPSAEINRPAQGYLEFHIEQGPVLESRGLPLAVVESIVGLTRLLVTFQGHANHAGTTPMHLRQDALAGAAEWICRVEAEALVRVGIVATVGRIQAEPGAANIIPGCVRASLDVRCAEDVYRKSAVKQLLSIAEEIAARRRLAFSFEEQLDQPACTMDPAMVSALERALVSSGQVSHRMASGAGHDAMIMARRMPAVMLFLRSPGGLSHHPDENVLEEDVAAALQVGSRLLDELLNVADAAEAGVGRRAVRSV